MDGLDVFPHNLRCCTVHVSCLCVGDAEPPFSTGVCRMRGLFFTPFRPVQRCHERLTPASEVGDTGACLVREESQILNGHWTVFS